jgi:hypothetical protein
MMVDHCYKVEDQLGINVPSKLKSCMDMQSPAESFYKILGPLPINNKAELDVLSKRLEIKAVHDLWVCNV